MYGEMFYTNAGRWSRFMWGNRAATINLEANHITPVKIGISVYNNSHRVEIGAGLKYTIAI